MSLYVIGANNMLNIKTGKDIDSIKKINDIESRFRTLVNNGEYFSDNVYTEIMVQIDGVISRDDKVIETRFGKTTLESLSTGCKSILLALFYEKTGIYVRIDECGENALKVLYSLAKGKDINVYITIPIPIYEEELCCTINNELYNGGFNIYRKLVELNGYN